MTDITETLPPLNAPADPDSPQNMAADDPRMQAMAATVTTGPQITPSGPGID